MTKQRIFMNLSLNIFARLRHAYCRAGSSREFFGANRSKMIQFERCARFCASYVAGEKKTTAWKINVTLIWKSAPQRTDLVNSRELSAGLSWK